MSCFGSNETTSGQRGAFDIHGNTVFKPIYDDLDHIENGPYWKAEVEGDDFIFSLDGEKLGPCNSSGFSSYILHSSKGALFKTGDSFYDRVGIYDPVNQKSNSGSFLSLINFGDVERLLGFYLAKTIDAEGYKYTVVDSKAKSILSGKWTNIEYNRKSELFKVLSSNGKYGVKTIKDEVILPPIYDYASLFGNYIIATLNNKKGVFDTTGKVILPLEYDHVTPDGDFFVVEKNKRKFAATKEGQIIAPKTKRN